MKKKLLLLFAVLFAAAMVVMPQSTETGTKIAIILWANSIIPVLLPFFIFCDFIKRTGMLQNLPPQIYSFVIAFMSGYPVGAKVVGDYVTEGALSKTEGIYILSYSLVTGPAFIIFTIGQFIGSTKGAIVVAAAHYFGAFLNSTGYRVDVRSKNRILPQLKSNDLENFTGAIIAGFKSMGIILAYLMFFNIAINIADTLGLWRFIGNNLISSLIKGFLEMTVGINAVGMCNIGLKLKVILASALVSFGGLSVIGQATSMASGSGITFADIAKIKITHSLWAGIVATLIVRFVIL